MSDKTNNAFALSPYLVPFMHNRANGGINFRWRVGVNIGDGFILYAIERLLGPFESGKVLSTRVKPKLASLAALSGARNIYLAGANQLTDNFAPWPNFDLDFFNRSRARFIPFGVGIDGRSVAAIKLTPLAREVIRAIHNRIEFSSWRCPQTVAFLDREFPELAGRFLMTGCPVIFDQPLLASHRFHDSTEHVAVTITDRGSFMDRETATLEAVARIFPGSRKSLVLHQTFQPATLFDATGAGRFVAKALGGNRIEIRNLARKLGFDVVAPKTAKEGLSFYRTVDLHIGSRLHAHLMMLSQNKKSFLTYVDERATGMATHFEFPICDPNRIDEYLNLDFEIVRRNAISTFETMSTFVRSTLKAI
jgi:hypothetical protein